MDVGRITTINSYVFGAISVCLNSILILVIYRRSLRILGSYKYMMIAASLLDVLLSAVYIVASPTFAAISDFSSLLIVKGGILLPRSYALAILLVFLWLLCESLVTPPCLFVFRYLQICRTSFLVNNSHVLRFFLIIPPLLATTSCAIIGFASWPTENDLMHFTEEAISINVEGNFAFLVASLSKHGSALDEIQTLAMWIGSIYLIIIMICTLAVMIFCTTSIMKASRDSTNGKTQSMQKRLFKLLVAQFSVPFLFIHVPFYISVFAPLFNLTTGSISNYLPFLFAWSPVINPLVILYFVRDYRVYLMRKIARRKSEMSSSNVFQTTVRKQ